ncbi:phage tail spike protein, partial [Bacillus toyonensis]
KESLQGVSRTISDVQNKQGEIDKKVTKFEQDSNGFKLSIESLTKKDTDISDKLNTVEQTVEGTKKTISDVQQTTNGLSKTTTEIKEEAGNISTKLEQVEARTVGGENWLINTGPNERPQTIGMIGGAVLNKVTSFVQPGEYVAIECQDHTDAFYQFHLDNTKIGDFEKGKDITISLDLQNDVLLDFILFQYINGSWSESVQKPVPAKDWRRESWTFKIDVRATGWGFRIRFARNEASKGKRFRFKKAKLEKGSVPTDFSKSTYELEQSVDGIKETETKVENNQSGFDKRVTEVEKSANGITQSVSKLQETQLQQGKTLTQATTTLEQHSEALSLTMKKKDVEEYVGGIGSINEIRNAGLELGTKYWSINQGTVIQPNSKYKGYATFWSDYSGKTSDHWSGTASEFISVTNGEDLISSGWFVTDSIASLDQKAWMEIEFWNATKGTRMRTQRVEIQWAKQGDWARMMMVSKVAANEEWVRWRYYVQRNGRIRAALPMLQWGKVATEFWLHPKDQTNVDKMIEDIADKVATQDYNKKTTELERLISANAEGIKLAAIKTEVYTKQQADGRYADKAYVEKQEGRI